MKFYATDFYGGQKNQQIGYEVEQYLVHNKSLTKHKRSIEILKYFYK